jgi:hypothetical protein
MPIAEQTPVGGDDIKIDLQNGGDAQCGHR